MATKKKPASKKASKPVKKAAPKKPAPKKVAPKKPAKPAAKKPAPPKPAKVAAKKPVEKPAKAADKKPSAQENKSLVSVKPQIKPIVKKEPPKPVKVVIPKTSTKSVKKYEPEFTKSVLDSQEQDAGAPSMRYSDTELTEFREIIMKKLDAAKKELNYLQGLITRKDESGDMDEGRYMTMEDGSVSMEREQLSQMASRQITFIDHLEKALMRIENKTYGICRVTGKLIDKARLRAVPHATLSIEAKQMMNK
jgi:RNA polymerase-binding transcription factor DksA